MAPLPYTAPVPPASDPAGATPRVPTAAVAGALALGAAGVAIATAARDAAVGAAPLAAATAWVGPLAALGAWLDAGAAAAPGALRALGLALAGLGLAVSARDARPDAPLRLGAALALAAVAESFGRSGSTATALAVGAAAALAWCWRRAATPPPAGALRGAPWLWLVAVLVFTGLALHEIDVFPDLHFDELAYLQAGHMRRGALPPGPIETPLFDLYTYARFRAQPLPLALHALALEALHPGLVGLRLASVACGALALWGAALALRRALGDAVACGAVTLAAASPLVLFHHRTGFYIAASVLHGVVAFAAGWRFAQRRDAGSALALGAVAGVSVYLYQLSWFVPPLAALALAVTLTRRTAAAAAGREAPALPAPALLAVAAGAALVVALPLLTLPGPLRALAAQTADKTPALRAERDLPSVALARVLLPEDADAAEARALRERALLHVPRAHLETSRRGRRVLGFSGPPHDVAAARDALEAAGARVLADSRAEARLGDGAGRALGRLFFDPHVTFVSHLVDVPIADPWLAPLLGLGVVEALRRRHEPAVRFLLAWTAGALLLPTAVTDAQPRRLVLAVPWIHALMALPLLAAGAALAARRPRWRRAGPAAAVGVALLAWSTGAHFFFHHWSDPFGRNADAPRALAVVRAVKAAGPGEAVRLAPALALHRALVRDLDPGPFATRARDVRFVRDASAAALRRETCAAHVPVRWIAPRSAGLRQRLAAAAFAVRALPAPDDLEVMRVDAAPPGACPAPPR